MKIPPTIKEAFLKNAKVLELPKRHSLLNQGQVSEQAYFVESGCLRMWHNDSGNDVTIKFFSPGDAVASLESFYQDSPSKFS
ncbi:MAG: cyclic nucleotide-binding domain-containing protein, partial [Pseudomonadota bacterium]